MTTSRITAGARLRAAGGEEEAGSNSELGWGRNRVLCLGQSENIAKDLPYVIKNANIMLYVLLTNCILLYFNEFSKGAPLGFT